LTHTVMVYLSADSHPSK